MLATGFANGCASRLSTPLASRSRTRPAARRHAACVRAQEGSGAPPPAPQQQQDDERRLEALEAVAKARKGAKAELAEASRPARSTQTTGSARGMAEWKEGQLFPEGWEDMDPLQKATELYMGKRGFMFWSGKATLWSVGLLLGGWVVFRFIGPALGLYSLENDLSTPNLL